MDLMSGTASIWKFSHRNSREILNFILSKAQSPGRNLDEENFRIMHSLKVSGWKQCVIPIKSACIVVGV